MQKLIFCVLTLISLLMLAAAPGCSAINTNQAVVHYNKGVTLSDAGNYDGAIAEYNKAIELDPKYTNAYINLGYTYYQKKQYDLAIPFYTKAIDLNPESYIAYNGRGASYLMTKQYQPAKSDYDKSLQLKPDQAQIITNRDYAAKMLNTTTTSTTTPPPTTNTITPQTLTGDWINKPGEFGLVLHDAGSWWNYNVEMSLQEEGQGKFSGTMKRTLVEITGAMANEPEIMSQIGNVQTASVSGTRVGSIVDFVFGDLTLHLTVGSDSYGIYLQGDTHFFDTYSPADAFKGLTDIRPDGVSGQDYMEWIYSINLVRK